nr:hypothetical protein [Tanacetum cinerariifolium]
MDQRLVIVSLLPLFFIPTKDSIYQDIVSDKLDEVITVIQNIPGLAAHERIRGMHVIGRDATETQQEEDETIPNPSSKKPGSRVKRVKMATRNVDPEPQDETVKVRTFWSQDEELLLAECFIQISEDSRFCADNRPPMLEKDMYDSWKIILELYMMNRQRGRMVLESVENDWLSIVETDKVIHIVEIDIVKLMVEIECFGMSYDKFVKETGSSDGLQPKQADISYVHALNELYLHEIHVVPSKHEADQYSLCASTESV